LAVDAEEWQHPLECCVSVCEILFFSAAAENKFIYYHYTVEAASVNKMAMLI
jgi:hypothetical protein